MTFYVHCDDLIYFHECQFDVRLTKNQLCCSSMPSHKFILQLSTQLLFESYLFISIRMHFAERSRKITQKIIKYIRFCVVVAQLLDHWLAS